MMTSSSSPSPEKIAQCALDHYHDCLPPQKGKPKLGLEWTVYAAIVASMSNDDNNNNNKNGASSSSCWVVSCATGTKCTALRNHGMILHDGHAEVLARRGLVRILQQEILQYRKRNNDNNNKDDPTTKTLLSQQRFLLEPIPVTTSQNEIDNNNNNNDDDYIILPTTFRLRQNLQLDLYISDSPCGDASIYSVQQGGKSSSAVAVAERPGETDDKVDTKEGPHESNNSNAILYTGAKIIVSESTGVTAVNCGGQQQLLAVNETETQQQQQQENTIETDKNNGTTGDISGNNNNNINNQNNTTMMVAREKIQLIGKLRTKSGRSNLPDHLRSSSMSCSDKIVQWSIIGLQGGMLSKWIPIPIRFTTIVISRDPRVLAMVVPSSRSSSGGGSTDNHPKSSQSILDSLSTSNENGPSSGSSTMSCPAATSNTISGGQAISQNNHPPCQQLQRQRVDNNNSHDSQDCQLEALQRAIPDRVKAVQLYLQNDSFNHSISLLYPPNHDWIFCGQLPLVRVVPQIFPSGKAATSSTAIHNTVSPPRQTSVESTTTTIAGVVLNSPRSIPNNEARGHNSSSSNNSNNEVVPRKRKHSTIIDEPRKVTTTVSPCGFSINWQQDLEYSHQSSSITTKDHGKKGNNGLHHHVELIVGARGVCQGKKPKSLSDYQQLASRLSRWKLTQTTLELASWWGSNGKGKNTSSNPNNNNNQKNVGTNGETEITYQKLKDQFCSNDWKELQRMIRTGGPLAGWLTNTEGGDFYLDPKIGDTSHISQTK